MGGANTNTLRSSHRSPSQPALSAADSHHSSRDRTRSPMSRREQQQQQQQRGHHAGASSRSLSPPQMRGREASNPWGVRVPPRPESSSALANSPKKRQLPQIPGTYSSISTLYHASITPRLALYKSEPPINSDQSKFTKNILVNMLVFIFEDKKKS